MATPAAENGPPTTNDQEATVVRIEQLLRTKNDTSRFVALALLKALLDNQPEASSSSSSSSTEVALRLWEAVPVKFLDRLLRTGSAQPAKPDAAHMRDLAIAVLHTFAVRLLPEEHRDDPRLLGRMPLLVASLLTTSTVKPSDTKSQAQDVAASSSSSSPDQASPTQASPAQTSSPQTSPAQKQPPPPPPEDPTTLILQTLTTLVSRPQGAAAFNAIDDLDALIELAPAQPLVLEVLLRAWLLGPVQEATLRRALPQLVAAFKGTDGVTLLEFVARLLRSAPVPPPPEETWLRPTVDAIRQLTAKRPTPEARSAYTHAAAALLRVYPAEASKLLFHGSVYTDPKGKAPESDSRKPFADLLVQLLLVDIRATLAGLAENGIRSPSYPATAARLAAAYDILSSFTTFLVQDVEDGDDDKDNPQMLLLLSPDSLLRLRKSMAETLSATAEHLHDRWDAATTTAQEEAVRRDPLILSALWTLALWLREDDNPTLRQEAVGLSAVLVALYSGSSSLSSPSSSPPSSPSSPPEPIDFRPPILLLLEGLTETGRREAVTVGGGDHEDEGNDDGGDGPDTADTIAVLLQHGLWKALATDLMDALRDISNNNPAVPRRGIDIVRVLLPIVESDRVVGTEEPWMGVVEDVAAWTPDADLSAAITTPATAEFRVAVLQLVAALVAHAPPAMCRQHANSIKTIVRLARRLKQSFTPARVGPDCLELMEDLDDILDTLENQRI